MTGSVVRRCLILLAIYVIVFLAISLSWTAVQPQFATPNSPHMEQRLSEKAHSKGQSVEKVVYRNRGRRVTPYKPIPREAKPYILTSSYTDKEKQEIHKIVQDAGTLKRDVKFTEGKKPQCNDAAGALIEQGLQKYSNSSEVLLL